MRPRPAGRGAAAPRMQDTVRLSADGLAKVVGDLEARVLRHVWALGEPVPARRVYEAVIEEHDVAPLTVITVLNKLVDKGFLRRARRGELLHYEARLSEAEFVAHASRRVVEGVLAFEPTAVAAAFIDVLAQQDPAQLAELGRLVQARLDARARGASPPDASADDAAPPPRRRRS